MKIRDTLERLVWTVIAACLGALPASPVLGEELWKMEAAAAFTAASTFILLVARSRLSVLPEPGAGLPGLATESTVRDGPAGQ